MYAALFCFSSSQSPVTIADGIDSSLTYYIFSYGTGSSIPISTNSTPQCTSSSCQHTFRATSYHIQQYTVTVAARNVVGVGDASTPVTVGKKQIMNTLECHHLKPYRYSALFGYIILHRNDSLWMLICRKGGTGGRWLRSPAGCYAHGSC